MSTDTLVSPTEAAELLGIPLVTARSYVSRGVFGPKVRRGCFVFVEREAVLAYTPVRSGQPRDWVVGLAEDAEWLLRCGEEADAIRRRLGYKTWESFVATLRANDYGELVERIIAWTNVCGHTPQGTPLRDDRKQYATR